MSLLSSRLSNIALSQTMAMGARAAALRAAGRDVISMALGEADYDIGQNVKTATIEAVKEGRGRSVSIEGLPELKQAIADKLRRENDLIYAPNQIIVSAGSKQVIFNAMMATLDPGDEVLLVAPYWVSYPEIVKLCGGTPVPVRGDPAQGYKLSPASLAKALTPRTRWLIVNSPCNPTGAVYSAAELRALAAVLEDKDVLILSDDIYERFIYPPAKFATMASAAPALKDRTLTVNGMSKAYAMIGWRLGYGAGPLELIQGMAKIQSQVTSSTCTIAQVGGIEALLGSQEWVNRKIGEYQQRRDRVVEHVRKLPALDLTRPDGGFYFFLGCSRLIGATRPDGKTITTDGDLCEYLLEKANVVTMPGSAFGVGPAMRLAYTISMPQIDEAFARIAGALRELRPK